MKYYFILNENNQVVTFSESPNFGEMTAYELTVDDQAMDLRAVSELYCGKRYDIETGEFSDAAIPEREQKENEHGSVYRALERAKKALANTDYVVIKLYEVQLLKDDDKFAELMDAYAPILSERGALRAEVNTLEGRLADLERWLSENR